MIQYKIIDTANFQLDGANSAILFDGITEKAFTLNGTGALIWQFLENGKSQEEIIQIFCDHGITRDRVEKSVSDFIEELKQHNFISEIEKDNDRNRVE